MSQSEFDIGPLTWVKAEIDAAILRAKEQVAHFAANIGDTSPLRFAQPHLHQVKGAIQMVGLDGVARFVEEIERFMHALETHEVESDADALDLLDQGMDSVGKFLDEMMAGAPNVPLDLFPLYKKLLEARKVERISESDLFFPDLSVRAPKTTAAAPVVEAEIPRYVRSVRTKYQKGLLGFLKNPNDAAGLNAMREALAQIEATQTQPASRTFWWSSVAFIDGLQAGGVEPKFNVKSLCGRIDQQIRRVAENSAKVAEKLNRDVLFYVATAKPATDRLKQVKGAFELETHLPQESAASPNDQAMDRAKPLLRDLTELVTGAKEVWLKFTSGNTDVLKTFQDQTRRAYGKSQVLGFEPLAGLIEKIANGADALAANGGSSESVSMEMATALLLTESAIQNFARLTPEFAHHAVVQGNRLQASLAGQPTDDIEQVPLLDEMGRKAQEKLLLAQIGTEIQTNLRHIEQVLDSFFRDNSKRADIPSLTSYVRQIFGALSILELERAADLLNACQGLIDKFADPEQEPVAREMELVAEGLSSLGFYIEAVQHGRADAFEIIAPVIKTFPGIKNKEVREADSEADTVTEIVIETPEVPLASIEAGIEEQKNQAHALFKVWQAAPDAANRSALRAQLTAILQDAELMDDHNLKDRASKTLATLDQAGEVPNTEIAQAITELTARKFAAVAPSKETARLLDASKEVIDKELLETYLEEAHEVLATVNEQLGIMRRRPHDHDALITIRRGFHTLKGSGRMVGLSDLGEVAWGIEQTMNRWLEEERDASPELLNMIQHAHDAFAGWVELLTLDGVVNVDANVLLAEAAALREDPSGPFDLSAKREAFAASRLAASEQADSAVDHSDAAFEAAESPLTEDTEIVLTDLAPTSDTEETLDEELFLEPLAEDEAPAETTAEDESNYSTSLLPLEPPPVEPQEIQIGDVSVSHALYQLFLDEATNYLVLLEQGGAELQANPSQAVSYDLMRAAHTLAGISSTVGFVPPADLAQAFEHWLMDILHNPRFLDADHLENLSATLASLKDMVGAIRNHVQPSMDSALSARLRQSVIDARTAREKTEMAALAAQQSLERELQQEEIEAPAVSEAESTEPALEDVVVEQSPAPMQPQAAPPPSLRLAPMPANTPPIEIDANIKDDLDEQLLPVFLEEAEELMPYVGAQLRAWRDLPNDSAAPQALNRILHTLKGSARMAGAMRLGDLTHRMEERVLSVSEGDASDEAVFDELDNYFDAINDIHEALITGDSATAQAAESAAPAATTGAAPAVLGRAPQAASPQAGMLAEMEQAAARAVLRVRADVVDRLVNEAGEVSITRSRIEGEMLHFKQSLKELTENVIRLRGQLREIEIQAESQMQSRISAAQDTQFDPLEFDRFTRLQEVTRMMAESVNDVSTVQLTMLKNLDEAEAALIAQARLNRELQQGLMRIRMVPMSSITERLHRIVRQTSKEVGKKAALIVEGEGVELDRSVLEKMTAPFEHLLRNAVAHGVEDATSRVAAGKNEAGTVQLTARQEGNEVVLTLSDDGGGIDLERVRAKAIDLGLMAADEEATPAKLTELIFNAGLSTASEVTQVSGRGVGMDVVRNEIASLGGRIEVETKPGQGTSFTVYLPLTLAVTQVVMVRSGENRFAIPASMVDQVQEVKSKVLADVYQQGKVVWQGNDYPLHYIPRLLGDEQTMPEAKPHSSIMLLRSGTHRAAIHVDNMERNQEVVIKNIGAQLARVSGISGATVLGNGQIVLIINPVQLAHRETAHTAQPLHAIKPQELVTAPVIMVVDDSLTVRKITGRLLAKEGYQVLTAKDGVDALQQLQDIRPAVMLVDIEMPRMDGFELTKNVRGDAATANIPIIMITSRTAEKHRNYARELGVNEYLGKPYQEEELLAHIANFVKQGVELPV